MIELCSNCGSDRHQASDGRHARGGKNLQSEIGFLYICLKCGWKWKRGRMGKGDKDIVRTRT